MAVRFSDDQVVKATGARRVRAGARASYDSISTDTRKLSEGGLFVALKGERHDAHDFLSEAAAKGAAALVVRKGVALPELPGHVAVFEVEDTLVALGGLGRFHRDRFDMPVGAVTGSNGKTTTKEMVAAILGVRGPALKTEGNLNNEVGVPLTLFGLEPGQVGAVIEMGMNHAGEIARLTAIARPNAGLITTVQAAHLAHLSTLDGVAAAKGELFLGLGAGATAVVNIDDPRITAQALRSGARMLTYGQSSNAEVRLVSVVPQGKAGLDVTVRYLDVAYAIRLGFVGPHNGVNAAGAFALAVALGWAPDECAAGLEAARPHAQRLTVLDGLGGLCVVDDCYNANPASVLAALETLATLAPPGRRIAVLGDMLELGPDAPQEHRRIGARAAELVRAAAFFGPLSRDGYEAAAKLGEHRAHFEDVNGVVDWVRARAEPGDVVLVKGSRGMKLERVVAGLTGGSPARGH